ncbi:MAG TPA: hypothetical protein PLG22_15405 [Kiritimatiellia bacterium]|nr:hypothetical protein [Kiritimatiellia bacterium]
MNFVRHASLWALVAATAAAAPFTYETPAALTSVGDWDNDGLPDAVLVDRATGIIRLGLQQADGSFLWGPSQPSGFNSPTSLSVGRFGGSWAGDQIALTEPDANRITLFTLPATNATLTARHVCPGQPMPHGLTALDAYVDGADDLVVFGEAGGASSYYERLASNLSGAPSVGKVGRDSSERTHRGFPFVRKVGSSPVALVIRGSRVSMAPVSPRGFEDGVILAEVVGTNNTLMAWGFFDGPDYPHVLLYRPGETNLVAAQVSEPEWEVFEWNAPAEYAFAKALQLVVTIPWAAGTRLAVLFTDGTAGIFDFDGSGAPVARATLAGNGYDWLLPLGEDALLSGRAGVVERWDTSPGGQTVLTPSWSGMLPAVRAASRYSNVVFVKGEPFVQPDAEAISLTRVFDWTSGSFFNGLSWTVEGMTQDEDGLGSSSSRDCYPPSSASFALVNQYLPNVSISLLEPSVGAPVPDIGFNPPGGTYAALGETEHLNVTFSPTPKDANVYWRMSPSDPWSDGSALSVELTGDAVIEAYAESAVESNAGPIRRATYTFAEIPKPQTVASVDADGDGMPDEWEKAFGVNDPLADADGDGASNLQEYLDRTDPRDAGSSATVVPFCLAATAVGEGEERVFVLEWPLAHASATLMCADSLQGEWMAITTGVEQTATGFRYVVPLAASPSLFFRLQKP